LKTSNKPIITELYFNDAEKAEVKRIEKEIRVTYRRDKLRALLGGPMCCCCRSIPNFHIEYPLDEITRIERYCTKCYHDIYLNTIDVTNESVVERYGIIKAPPGTFGGPTRYEQ
jgi:hypothetical protein